LLDQFKDNQGATAVINSLADAFSQLGQAVGQTVEALVLYGNAGGNLQQVTAKILAAVASQAAVKAVFELAEGLACLALAFFGDPSAGAAATMHFAAAAAYGSIAAVAGLAGRAVAGNSFKQGAAGAGGGVSSSTGAASNGQADNFRSPMADAYSRMVTVTGQMTLAVNTFNQKFNASTPDAVVTAGAQGAGQALTDSIQNHTSNDLRAGNNFQRVIGVPA
jgi:hypothetical protein